ncbi:MAG: hypothetical protein V4524_02380 [Patescibacteria group bacterium]
MKSEKGYTLLFAVIVSVLVLSIAAFILSVSRKQAILASSARDSVYAFYAADSGLECAIKNLTALAKSTPDSISCGANLSFTPGRDTRNTDLSGTTTFPMFTGTGNKAQQTTQSGIGSCAIITTTYSITGATQTQGTSTVVTVIARGYNIGWNTTDCVLSGPRKVERALQYTQFQ